MAARPVFLFVMIGQHGADWSGCTGHPVLKTPHIDSRRAGPVELLAQFLIGQMDESPRHERVA